MAITYDLEGNYELENGVQEIGNCDDAEDLGLEGSSPLFTATTIALHIELRKRLLGALKVPPSISNRSFSLMEKLAAGTLTRSHRGTKSEYLDKIETEYHRLGKQLASDLNKYAATRKDLPRFRYRPECGDGHFEVEIKTIPPGATVTYIPIFCYKLCQERKIDAQNPDLCDGWRTALTAKVGMIGEYRFKAVWPDGTQKSGTTSINSRNGPLEINKH
jgi:hypothetical protein